MGRGRRSAGRVAAVVASAIACAPGAGCGAAQEPRAPATPPAPLDNVLGYFPQRAAAVVAVPTDLRGEQFRSLDRAVTKRLFEGATVEKLVRATVEDERKLSYRRDVRPLLGNYLVVGTPTQRAPDGNRDIGVLAALQVRDPLRVRGVVGRIRDLRRKGEYRDASLYVDRELGMALAIHGDVLLAADSRFALRRAIRQRTRSDRLTETRFDEALPGLPRDALIRGYGDLSGLLRHREVRRFRGLPWVDALRTSGFAAKFDGMRLDLSGVLATEPARVTPADLPFPSGHGEPPLFRRDRQILGGSSNQSQTTVFLLRAVRRGHPGSRFVRHVGRIERELGIDFEDEVLRQFNGPSSSILGLDGRFAARSTVADPGRFGVLLNRLAPRLPQLIQDLNRIDTEGLSLLLLFAPDAPVAAGRIKGPRVRRLAGPGQLYRVSGLRHGRPPPQNPDAVPPAVVFGLVDEVFVVASDERRARAAARAPASPAAGLSGASVTTANLGRMRRALKDYIGFDLGPMGQMTGELTASQERLQGKLSLEFR